MQFAAKTFTEFIPNYKKHSQKISFNPNFHLKNNNLQPQINVPIHNNNLYYESQINELRRQLNEEKNKNIYLINENANLRNTINNLNIQIGNIKNYENKINQLNLIIQDYQSRLNNQFSNHYNNTITSIKPGEIIMTVNFVSMGINDIGHYSLPCKNTDLFVRLEEKLNNDYPQLKNHETYFEVQTRRIKRFKTLDENNIKSNDIINIFIADA